MEGNSKVNDLICFVDEFWVASWYMFLFLLHIIHWCYLTSSAGTDSWTKWKCLTSKSKIGILRICWSDGWNTGTDSFLRIMLSILQKYLQKRETTGNRSKFEYHKEPFSNTVVQLYHIFSNFFQPLPTSCPVKRPGWNFATQVRKLYSVQFKIFIECIYSVILRGLLFCDSILPFSHETHRENPFF